MTMYDIVKGALQRIPASVRKLLLVALAIAVVTVEVAQILEASWDFERIYRVIALAGGYLGVQSAANVLPDIDRRKGHQDAHHDFDNPEILGE